MVVARAVNPPHGFQTMRFARSSRPPPASVARLVGQRPLLSGKPSARFARPARGAEASRETTRSCPGPHRRRGVLRVGPRPTNSCAEASVYSALWKVMRPAASIHSGLRYEPTVECLRQRHLEIEPLAG